MANELQRVWQKTFEQSQELIILADVSESEFIKIAESWL